MVICETNLQIILKLLFIKMSYNCSHMVITSNLIYLGISKRLYTQHVLDIESFQQAVQVWGRESFF